MRNVVNLLYIFVMAILFSCSEVACAAPKVAPKVAQKPATPLAKKEIFIAGLSKEYLKGVSSDDAVYHSTNYAVNEVENDLLEAYAKTRSLPTFAKHQKEFENRVKRCEDNIAGRIAVEVVRDKVNKLSPADVKSYHGKIKANPSAYDHVWEGQVPEYSDALIDEIKAALEMTWRKPVIKELEKQPKASLKSHRFYKKAMASCKGGPGTGFYLSPYVAAARDAVSEEANQKVRAMTKEQRQKYREKYKKEYGEPLGEDWMADNYIQLAVQQELLNDILQKMATEHTIKSDSPYILEAVKKAQNRTLFGPL